VVSVCIFNMYVSVCIYVCVWCGYVCECIMYVCGVGMRVYSVWVCVGYRCVWCESVCVCVCVTGVLFCLTVMCALVGVDVPVCL
jgi:Na+-transporting NADH:ubiquinone oxidoreductase subunit NqrB